jgi:hypothetical protein
LTDIGKRIGFKTSDLVDTFDFDSINSPPQQNDEVKSGIRRLHKVGLFKMEGRNKSYADSGPGNCSLIMVNGDHLNKIFSM